MRRRFAAVVLLVLSLSGLAACGAGSSGSSGDDKVVVGLVNSYTGQLASWGPSWEAGYRAGLKVLTGGTMKVDGHKIDVEVKNDNSDPTTGISAAKELVGKGARMIVGPTSSAVVLPVAQLCLENKVAFIEGTSATVGLDGMGPGIFRSAPTTPQLTAAVVQSAVQNGDKRMVYLGQDYAYGKDSAAALKSIGSKKGIAVDSVLLPVDTQDFTAGVARALSQHPDAIYVGWAGKGQPQLFKALADQRAFDKSHVVTIGPARPQFDSFAAALGANLSKVELITYYGEGTMKNPAETAMLNALKDDDTPIDIEQPSGYLAAAMTVKAIKEAGPDLAVDAVNKALSGASFQMPVGDVTIRPEDHLPIESVYGYSMVKAAGDWRLKLVKTYAAPDLVPPVKKSIR